MLRKLQKLSLDALEWQGLKQARKSSEDTQVAVYARFEKVQAG